MAVGAVVAVAIAAVVAVEVATVAAVAVVAIVPFRENYSLSVFQTCAFMSCSRHRIDSFNPARSQQRLF